MTNNFSDDRFNAVFLRSLLITGQTDAIWERGGGIIPGRFRIDPFEVPTGGIMPGIGEIQTWFYCDRRVVPPPLPELGDVLTIRSQVWEIVQRDEDDIGELGYRLIKEELGLIFPEPSVRTGDWERAPGRPSRRTEIAAAFETAANAGVIGPDLPMSEVVSTVRERIPGDRRGLGDKTLRRTLGPLVAARRGRS